MHNPLVLCHQVDEAEDQVDTSFQHGFFRVDVAYKLGKLGQLIVSA